MDAGDLDCVLAWRNHEDVRRYMYSTHSIQPTEHRRWFEAASADPRRYLLILETANGPRGFVSIGSVCDGGIANWGFYNAPGAERGTGRILGELALSFAFGELRLHKICGEALAENTASIRFHERLGFRREGELVDQFHDGERYHSVIRFGLLDRDWLARNKGGEDA